MKGSERVTQWEDREILLNKVNLRIAEALKRSRPIDDVNASERAEELRASPRPASDARRAWRQMLDWQRREFMVWLAEDETGAFDDNDQIR